MIMSGPGLKEGFYVLSGLKDKAGEAAVKKNVPEFESLSHLSALTDIDLIVTGSVAVDHFGGHLGKGTAKVKSNMQ